MSFESTTHLAVRRFLLPSGVLLAVALSMYLSQPIELTRSGSSWQGYVLGGVATALLLWLAALGIRKRKYATNDSIQRWVAAHMLLGLSVVVVVVLHSGAQLNWNVHGLGFLLLLLVVTSGVVGSGFYLLFPQQLVRLRQGKSQEDCVVELRSADADCLISSQECSLDVDLAVRSAITGTVLADGLFSRLRGVDLSTISLPAEYLVVEPLSQPNTNQSTLLSFIAKTLTESEDVTHIAHLQKLLRLVARRQELLRRMRADIRLQSWLRAWLFVHVPLTIALLVAVVVHVFVVFFYW